MYENELDERLAQETTAPYIREMILKSIHEYPDLFKSKESVLKQMFLQGSYEWVDGALVNGDRSKFEGPHIVTMAYAKQVYLYGSQRHTTMFGHCSKTYAPFFHIPKDIKPEWLEVLKNFLYYINHLVEKEYKLYVLSYYVKCYSLTNPHAYINYDRACAEFKELREYSNQLAKDLDLEHISVDSLHNPVKVKEHAQEFSKMITEILDSAEGHVQGSYSHIKQQDAMTYVRRYGADIFQEVINESKNLVDK